MHPTSPLDRGDEPLNDTTEAPPPSKRLKLDDATEDQNNRGSASNLSPIVPSDPASVTTNETILPPSHSLLGTALPQQDESGAVIRLMESDVGISEYIAKDVPKICGIIKQRCALLSCTQRLTLTVQRFTDFLVYEVDQDSNVIHIKSLGMPELPSKKAKVEREPASEVIADVPSGEPSVIQGTPEVELGIEAPAEASNKADAPTVPWPDSFTSRLVPFLSLEKIEEVKVMFLEGPEPPFVSDTGWAGRQTAKVHESGNSSPKDIEDSSETTKEVEGEKGRSKRGRDRGGRGGRGRRGGRGGKQVREDHRQVTSKVRVSSVHVVVL